MAMSYSFVVLMTDSVRFPDPSEMMKRLPAGSVVILRHYDGDNRPELGKKLRKLTRQYQQKLLVAGWDWRLAENLDADGIHLPEFMMRHGVLSPLLGWCRRKNRLLTMTAHSFSALSRARQLGADWAIVSPIFITASHPEAPALGMMTVRQWTQKIKIPIVALGGINVKTLPFLRHTSLKGVAFGSEMKTCCLRAIKQGKL